jgi:hypothetical protein
MTELSPGLDPMNRNAACRVRAANRAAIFPEHQSAYGWRGHGANEALCRGALQVRKAGVAVVLSDFLDPVATSRVTLVGRGFQVNAVQSSRRRTEPGGLWRFAPD